MTTVAAPSREQVESLVRKILRQHGASASPTNGRMHEAPAGPTWWSTSRRGIVI